MRWALWSCDVSLMCWALCVIWLLVWYVGLCGHVSVSLMHWALWSYDCQSDAFGLCDRVTVSLMRWALWSYDCQCDALACGFVVAHHLRPSLYLLNSPPASTTRPASIQSRPLFKGIQWTFWWVYVHIPSRMYMYLTFTCRIAWWVCDEFVAANKTGTTHSGCILETEFYIYIEPECLLSVGSLAHALSTCSIQVLLLSTHSKVLVSSSHIPVILQLPLYVPAWLLLL